MEYKRRFKENFAEQSMKMKMEAEQLKAQMAAKQGEEGSGTEFITDEEQIGRQESNNGQQRSLIKQRDEFEAFNPHLGSKPQA